MLIKIEEACVLAKKDGYNQTPICYLEEIHISTPPRLVYLKQGTIFQLEQAEMLKKASIKEINVFYTQRLYNLLYQEFPLQYKKPDGSKSIIDLDRMLERLQVANTHTRKKRSLLSACEVYKKGNLGFTPVLHYGELMDGIRWNQLKSEFKRDSKIDFYYDEPGIIVFFILKPKSENYAQKFMKFTDLVSVIVEKLYSRISNHFNPNADLYTVNEPEKLEEVYLNTKSSLIIIGEDLTDDYKIALTRIKTLDRFAKFILVKNLDLQNLEGILKGIQNAYNKNLWEEETAIKDF